jgi:hypothetical protein
MAETDMPGLHAIDRVCNAECKRICLKHAQTVANFLNAMPQTNEQEIGDKKRVTTLYKKQTVTRPASED